MNGSSLVHPSCIIPKIRYVYRTRRPLQSRSSTSALSLLISTVYMALKSEMEQKAPRVGMTTTQKDNTHDDDEPNTARPRPSLDVEFAPTPMPTPHKYDASVHLQKRSRWRLICIVLVCTSAMIVNVSDLRRFPRPWATLRPSHSFHASCFRV